MKAVLITGCFSGIGWCVAQGLKQVKNSLSRNISDKIVRSFDKIIANLLDR